MAFIRSSATALPPHRIPQAAARAAYASIFGNGSKLTVFDHAGVESRCFAHELEYYLREQPFSRRNADYVREGVLLAERAILAALKRAGRTVRDIDHLVLVTTTGLATPSLDALLCHKMGFRSDVVRHPLFGIGCAGGVAAVARAAKLLGPRERALVVSVELCSQTFRIRDGSLVSLVGAALFGDGAAALVMEGDAIGSGAKVVDSRAELFPDSQDVMGWEFVDDGMKLVMSSDIPGVVRELAMPAVERFRAGRRVDHWVLHPGGPKVLAAYGLDEAAIAPSRESLRTIGNLSSAAVLFVLDGVEPKPGQTALMAAVGPGFGVEMAYLQW